MADPNKSSSTPMSIPGLVPRNRASSSASTGSNNSSSRSPLDASSPSMHPVGSYGSGFAQAYAPPPRDDDTFSQGSSSRGTPRGPSSSPRKLAQTVPGAALPGPSPKPKPKKALAPKGKPGAGEAAPVGTGDNPNYGSRPKGLTKAERKAKALAKKLAATGGGAGGDGGAVGGGVGKGSGADGGGGDGGKKEAKKGGKKGGEGEQGAGSNNNTKGSKKKPLPPAMPHDDPKKVAKQAKKAHVVRTIDPKQHPLFGHLPSYVRESSLSLGIGFGSHTVHPDVIQVGLKMSSGVISGANARTVGMLTAFKSVIRDYVTPPQKTLKRDFPTALTPCIQFLVDARPLTISMGNAIRYLKAETSQLPDDIGEAEAKAHLLRRVDDFISERVVFADQVIAGHGVNRIEDGDVVLTYLCSHVVELVLTKAHQDGKRFRVIIVDSRPGFEGKEMLRRLVEAGVACTYVLINAASYVMKEVSKVFLGCESVLTNGVVVSAAGTALVAMVASNYHVPVLIVAETYKFGERVQLDSICSNELADPDKLASNAGTVMSGSPLAKWRSVESLKLLNIVFDVTPIEYVAAVITEMGMIPPTSVPVIIREYRKEPHL